MPKDLKLNGNEETFTITAVYSTGDLYGKVVGKREITICREASK